MRLTLLKLYGQFTKENNIFDDKNMNQEQHFSPTDCKIVLAIISDVRPFSLVNIEWATVDGVSDGLVTLRKFPASIKWLFDDIN